jgi:DNA-directed RNA polymerase beta' subunit
VRAHPGHRSAQEMARGGRYITDEMNLHVAQDPCSRVEIQELMGLPHHIVTPQNSEPITSLKQDSLLGVYLLTLEGVHLRRDHVCQLTMAVQYPRQALPAAAMPGRAFLSIMLPATMRLARGSLSIQRGVLLAGKLTKGAVKAMVHYMWKLAPLTACEFLSDMQRVANQYILIRGVSIGIRDCLTDAATHGAIRAMLAKVDALHAHVRAQADEARIPHKRLEGTVARILSSAINYAGQVCQSALTVDPRAVHTSSTIQAMVDSGSKGSMMNIAQIMGVVGQQFVDSRRIKRRLTCFAPTDASPAARGFVAHSYLQGLTPAEFFHHAMGGREGLVDTSVKTATTGYMQRKLMKGMESCKAAYDGTVRNSCGEVVQFTYGGDNYDATHLVKVELAALHMDDDALRGHARTPAEFDLLRSLRDAVRDAFPLDSFRPTWPREVFMPFHGEWLLDKYREARGDAGHADHAAWLDAWMAGLQATLAGLGALPTLRLYAAWEFRHAVMAQYTHRTAKRLALAVDAAVNRARVAPMEMVGALAAQSCGEPATQLTLNSLDWPEVVVVQQGGLVRDVPIGELVDGLMDGARVRVLEDGTEYLDVAGLGLRVPAIAPDGTTAWEAVTAVTRHPVVNEDGSNTLVRVTTRHHGAVTATKAKSFLTRRGGAIVPTRGDELHVGDRLPTVLQLPFAPTDALDVAALFPPDLFTVADGITSKRLGKFEHSVPLPRRLALNVQWGTVVGAHVACGASTMWARFHTRGAPACRLMAALETLGFHGTEALDGLVVVRSPVLAHLLLHLPPLVTVQGPSAFARGALAAYMDAHATPSRHSVRVAVPDAARARWLTLMLARFGAMAHNLDDGVAVVGADMAALWRVWAFPKAYLWEDSHRVRPDDFVPTDDGDVRRAAATGAAVDGVYYDAVVAIAEVAPARGRAYDLTVANRRTFLTASGVWVMDTFHASGTLHSVSQGVPRLTELLNLNKQPKTPSVTVPLRPPYCASEEFASALARNLPFTVLHHLVTSSIVRTDAALDELDRLYARVDPYFAKAVAARKLCRHSMQFQLNMEGMLGRGMTPQIVAARLRLGVKKYMASASDKGAVPVFAVTSLYSSPQWHMRLWFGTARGFKDELLPMQEHLRRLLELQVCGVPGITAAQAVQAPHTVRGAADGAYVQEQRWQVVTAGSNLVGVLLMEAVDARAVICNSAFEVWRTFGLHAAAKMLFYEIKRVLSFDTTVLHDRHIMMIVHSMTRTGELQPMNRHGINKRKTGPLIRSSFEQTLDVFTDAAAFGEVDDMAGVSENIMAGQLAPLGTGGMAIIDPFQAPRAAPEEDDVVCSCVGDDVVGDAMVPLPCLPLEESIFAQTPLHEGVPLPQAPKRARFAQFESVEVAGYADDVPAWVPASPPHDPNHVPAWVPRSPLHDPHRPACAL